MPGSENTVRIKAELLGKIFSKIKQLTPNSKPEVLTSLMTNPDQTLYNNMIESYGRNPPTRIKIKCNPKIYFNKFNNSSDQIAHNEFFKGALITLKSFREISGCQSFSVGTSPPNETLAYSKIANVTEELTLFLNGFSCKSISDLKSGDILNFASDEIIKDIVAEFFTKVIFKKDEEDETKLKYFDMEEIKMKKGTADKDGSILYEYMPINHFQLNKVNKDKDGKNVIDIDKDTDNINTIYEIPITASKSAENPIIWSNDGVNSIYNKDDQSTMNPLQFKTKSESDAILRINTEFKKNPAYKLMYDIRLLCTHGYQNLVNTNKYIYKEKSTSHVMIKYFLLIINNIIYIKNGEMNKNTYRVILFFIYKYVNFIVKQGSAIVTNLEHLKFFFLSNTDNIKTYNDNFEMQDDKEKQIEYNKKKEEFNLNKIKFENLPNPKQASIDKYTKDKDDFEEYEKTFLENKKSQRNFVCKSETECNNLKNDKKIYNVETVVDIDENKKPITISETVDMGMMNNYRLLAILQDLANQNSDINSLKIKQLITGTNTTYTLELSEPKAGKANDNITMFSTIVHIKDLLDNDSTDMVTYNPGMALDEKIKIICTAELDSLEFAESISSTTQGKLREENMLLADEEAKLRAASLYGGSRKSYKSPKKFSMKELTKKNKMQKKNRITTIKKQVKTNNKKTLFARRSKKYQD